jgi:hypothetical protein
MNSILRVVDEHFGSGGAVRRPAVELRLVSEQITAREIIQRRVEAEVETLNQRKFLHFERHAATRSFLIELNAASPEAVLNPRGRRPAPIQVDRETSRAFEAFEKQRFIMLIDGRQVEGLDSIVAVQSASEAVFLYLMPLKGG